MSNHIIITKELKHKLRSSWNKLTEGKNYLIPETHDDMKLLGPFPYFQVGQVMVYAKDDIKNVVLECAELLRKELGADLFSKDTLVEIIRNEIRDYFSADNKKAFDWHLKKIIASIKSKDSRRQYVQVVSSLELEDVEEIEHSCWRLIHFTVDKAKEFAECDSGSTEWQSDVKKFLKKHCVGKTCLLVESRGDKVQASIRANHITNYVVNTLRYFICVHLAQSGYPHEVGIFVGLPYYQKTGPFSFNLDVRQSTMHFGSDHYRQKYKLNSENLKIMRECWHAETLWSLVEKSACTELEDSIVTAITWLGDAHQEANDHVAYVKYWTALEALVTAHCQDKITARLKTCIPILISHSSDEVPSKTNVGKAYALRCQIIHSGRNTQVTRADVNRVCTWTYQCIATCLHLATMGYTTRAQVEKDANRMDKLKKSKLT